MTTEGPPASPEHAEGASRALVGNGKASASGSPATWQLIAGNPPGAISRSHF